MTRMHMLACFAFLLMVSVSHAQWSSDPASNFSVADATGDQVQPKVASTSDGGCYITWFDGIGSGFDVRAQKLDAAGNEVFAHNGVLVANRGFSSTQDYGLDVDASGNAIVTFRDNGGSGIQISAAKVSPAGVLLWGPTGVHQTGGFGSPRHLLTQKFDSSGVPLWGGSHVAVFDGGSLQFGNFPSFVPDGGGGAVFSWYDTASLQLQCFAQRVLANGTEAFPHNGSAVSTDVSRVRVSPSASFDGSTQETFVFWVELNSTQSQSGLYGQKLDSGGVRQWTSEGTSIVPVGADEITMVRGLTAGTGAFAFWSAAPGFGQDQLYGAHLDGAGSIDIAAFDVASTASGKSRLSVARSSSGFAILAWSDDRGDAGDVLAQNVNADGTLGSATGVTTGRAGAASMRLEARPNPMRDFTRLEYSVPWSAAVDLEIYDVRGRLVRAWRADGGADRGAITWDGRDDRDAPVAAGVYFARLRSRGVVHTARVAVVNWGTPVQVFG